MYFDILPEALKTLRARRNWSQEKLAEEAGIERRTIMKKEGAKGAVRTRDFIAKRIAKALRVDVADLCRVPSDDIYFLDVDILHHLRMAKDNHDTYNFGRLYKYIFYNLSEILHDAGLELSPNWIEEFREDERPVMPSTAAGKISLRLGNLSEADFGKFLREWYNIFGQSAVEIEVEIENNFNPDFINAVKQLPVLDKDEINVPVFRSLLRDNCRISVDGLILTKFFSFVKEIWWVRPDPTPPTSK